MTSNCPWCVNAQVSQPGQLCARCAAEPDAIEFKQAHDRECACMDLPTAQRVPKGQTP